MLRKLRAVGITIALLFAASITGIPGSPIQEAQAAEIVAEGDSNLRGEFHWELDSKGTFTMSGEGSPPSVSLVTGAPEWEDYKNQIRRVVIEDGIWSTGDLSFEGCTNLTEVTFASSVTTIGSGAFKGCAKLKTIQFPRALETIDYDAFLGCTGLTELTFPDSIASINSSAFSGCTGLKELTFPTGTDIGYKAFFGCPALQSVVLPDGEDGSVGLNAFAECPNLKTVYWPLELTFANSAFIDSHNLTVYYEGTFEQWESIATHLFGEKVPDGTIVKYNSGIPGEETDPDPEEPEHELTTPKLQSVENRSDGILFKWFGEVSYPDATWWLDSGFYILRKSGSGDYKRIATVDDADATSYLDADVTLGTTYTYTVQRFSSDEVSEYDKKGLTITREKTLDGIVIYPNDNLGWSVANNVLNFGRDPDNPIADERYEEVFGTKFYEDVAGKFNQLVNRFKGNGGYCFGLSLLAAAQYNGQIDLSVLFSDFDFHGQSKSSKLANGAITSIVQSDTTGKYYAKMENERLVNTIERAHVAQYTKEVKNSQIYQKDPHYEGLLRYLQNDNSRPLLIGLSGSSYHAVLTYPRMKPKRIADNQYKIYLYDPNVPQIGHDSTLVPYAFEGKLSDYYTSGMSYLNLNTDSGDWKYYNPSKGTSPELSSSYYEVGMSLDFDDKGNHLLHHENIVFYDVSKISKSMMDCIIDSDAEAPQDYIIIDDLNRDGPGTLAIVDVDSGATILSASGNIANGTLKVSLSGDYVDDYLLGGEGSDMLYLALSDSCAAIEIQGGGIDATYHIDGTLFDVSCAGAARIICNPSTATVSCQADEASDIKLGVQRNSQMDDTPDAKWVSISTHLSAGDKTTMTIPEDELLELSGPDGQRYDASYGEEFENGSMGGYRPDATVQEILAHWGTSVGNIFTDVPSDAYYADAVLWAVKNEVTTGTSSTTFSPEDPCTRAQAVTFLWRAAGCPEPEGARNPFTDVGSGDYYHDAVLWAVEQGITTGTSDTTFSPNDTCTRAQIVTFLHRSEGCPDIGAYITFIDVPLNEYYADAVSWAATLGITTGTSRTHFSPNIPCTRGQIVTFLHRTYR